MGNDPTDCSSLVPVSKKSKEILKTDKLEALADKGYFSADNIKSLHDNGIDAFISEPKHGMPGKNGIPAPEFHESRFRYSRETDTYTCPQGNEMHASGKVKRRGNKTFTKYTTGSCPSCPVRVKCTGSRSGRKMMRREH